MLSDRNWSNSNFWFCNTKEVYFTITVKLFFEYSGKSAKTALRRGIRRISSKTQRMKFTDLNKTRRSFHRFI